MIPHEVAEDRLKLADEYTQACDELAGILAAKPKIWNELRAKYNSDKATDRAFEASDLGIREMQLRLIMKGLEKKLSATKTMLEVLQGEARNLY